MKTCRQSFAAEMLRHALKSFNAVSLTLLAALTAYLFLYLIVIQKLDAGSNPKYTILTELAIAAYSFLWGYVWSSGKQSVRYWMPTLLLPVSLCIMEFVNFSHVLRFALFSQIFHFSFWTVVWFLFWNLLLECGFPGCDDSDAKHNTVRKVLVFIQSVPELLLLWLSISIMINALLNGGIDSDAVVAMCQTNVREAWDYFWGINHGALLVCGMGISFLLCAALFVAARYRNVYLSRRICPPWQTVCIFRLETLGIIAVLVVVGWWKADMLHKMPMTWVTVLSYHVYRGNIEEYKALVEKRRQVATQYLAQYREQEASANNDGIYVLIIGESLDRRYMGCYGAKHDTTPFQSQLRKEPGAVFFDLAFACHVQTTRVVPMMLTMYDQYLPPGNALSDAELSLSILDIAGVNGFRTYWFSNQEKISNNNSIITSIATSADECVFLVDHVPPEGRYDDKLLPILENTRFADRSLVIIHLIGNHYPYGLRFPGDYPFPNGLTQYEQSVYYNDVVLRQITDFFQARGAKMIAYVSDHSDAVSIDKGHDPRPGKFCQEMVEIPLWFLMSEEYCEHKAQLFEKLKASSGKAVTNDLLFNMLMDLMSFQVQQEIQDQSPLSDDYILDPGRKKPKTLDGQVEILIP